MASSPGPGRSTPGDARVFRYRQNSGGTGTDDAPVNSPPASKISKALTGDAESGRDGGQGRHPGRAVAADRGAAADRAATVDRAGRADRRADAEADDEQVDLAVWVTYFDEVEKAMHEFEVGLSRNRVIPIQPVPEPPGQPPEELRRRSQELYRWVTELEFRARFIREEMRVEFARLPKTRRPGRKADWNYGSSLDING